MNVIEARQTLRPPLRFGNEAQIQARKFLEQVEEAKDAIRVCQHDDIRWCGCLNAFEQEVIDGAAFEIAQGRKLNQ